jgi:hypothetical protein
VPPLPIKNPPAPPAAPVPAAPLAPLPINGRLNNALVGALITPNTSCPTVRSGDTLAASAAAYMSPSEVNACANVS